MRLIEMQIGRGAQGQKLCLRYRGLSQAPMQGQRRSQMFQYQFAARQRWPGGREISDRIFIAGVRKSNLAKDQQQLGVQSGGEFIQGFQFGSGLEVGVDKRKDKRKIGMHMDIIRPGGDRPPCQDKRAIKSPFLGLNAPQDNKGAGIGRGQVPARGRRLRRPLYGHRFRARFR